MTDTSPAMAALRRRLVMARTGAERLRMGCAMFDVARALMRAGLGVRPGGSLSPDLRVALFVRTYGRDFDAATAARIAAHLRAAAIDAANPSPAGQETTRAAAARRGMVPLSRSRGPC